MSAATDEWSEFDRERCAVCDEHGRAQCSTHSERHAYTGHLTYEGYRAIVHGLMLLWCMCCEQYTPTSEAGCIRCYRTRSGGPSACETIYRTTERCALIALDGERGGR